MRMVFSVACAILVTSGLFADGSSEFATDSLCDAEQRFQSLPLLKTESLIDWLKEHRPGSRTLSQWHIHHTWDPRYADFNGGNHAELQIEMWKLHVLGNGWDDVAQHFTLFPDGMWIQGRDIEKDPASIRGWNRGALAVEMVGNFDEGEDVMTPLQAQAILEMSRFMRNEWKLVVRFHRDHPDSGKTCPGSSIDRSVFMQLLGETTYPTKTPAEFQR